MSNPRESERSTVPSEDELLAAVVDLARQHLDEPDRFHVPLEKLSTQRLVADLGLDSVQLLTLAMEVENLFEIVLDEVDPLSPAPGPADDAGASVETVGDLVATVRAALVRRERGREEG